MQLKTYQQNALDQLDRFGIAPGATGEKSSEQFVRELRDSWDESKR